MTSEEYLDNLLKSMEDTEVNQSDNPLIKKIITDIEEEKEELNIENEIPADANAPEELFAMEELLLSGDEIVKEVSAEEVPAEEVPVEEMFSDGAMSLEELLMTESIAKETETVSESNFFGEAIPMEDSAILAELMEELKEKSEMQDGTAESTGNEEEWKSSLDEFLAENVAEPEDMSASLDNMDVTELIDSLDNVDDDLSEISDLLKKSDNNEAVEADMMDLLGSLQESTSEAAAGDMLLTETVEVEKPVKKKKFKFPGFKKKKKETENAESTENAENIESAESTQAVETDVITEVPKIPDAQELAEEMSAEDMAAMQKLGFSEAEMSEWEALLRDDADVKDEEVSEPEEVEDKKSDKEKKAKKEKVKKEKKEKKEKKPGFWSNLFQMLTQEEETVKASETADENDDILKQLDQEDKEKAKKKEKKEKKGKKDKGAKKNAEKAEKSAKKQKPPKERKEKPKKEEGAAKKGSSVDIFTTRLFLVLVAFGATVIAAVVALSFFLNDYADKKAARDAFYIGEYEKTYVLLCDKNLSESDELILGRVRVILELERNKEVYEFYAKLGEEANALNALLNGVRNYADLSEENEYGAAKELKEIYLEILNILDVKYGIDESMAIEIITYEKEAYSKTIYAIADGVKFDSEEVAEEEEDKHSQSVEDVLPEEEAIINMEAGNEGA